MQAKDKPLLSVFMPAFNHGRFIAQALDGCLAQETDFPFQILVCDDCSSDNTRDIVDEYAARHPNIIRLYQPRNSKGANNMINGLRHADTKYLAMCEGDDYWTDPHKLRKQVDFLEANPDFNVCSHRVKIIYEEGVPHTAGDYVYKNLDSEDPLIRDGVFTAEQAMDNYYFHTSSLVFRWRFPDGMPPWFAKRMLWDHFLFLLHAQDGLIKYFDEPMSCWRHHASGWTYLQNIDKNIFFSLKHEMWDQVYGEMDKFFNYRFRRQVGERRKLSVSNALEYCLKNNEIDNLRHLVRRHAGIVRAGLKTSEIMRKAWDIIHPAEREYCLPWAAVKKAKPRAEQQIGGYKALPMELLRECNDSVWAGWIADREHSCFATVNQAILHWLWDRRAETVWLPNFYDPLIDYLRAEAQITPVFYECGWNLRPSPEIARDMPPGDAIITCAWFGAPTPPELAKALAERSDIHWIEDRRHALGPMTETLAPAAAYSAPDLLGLPDGGLLVGKDCAGLDANLPMEPEQVLLGSLKYRIKAYDQGGTDIEDRLGLSRERERAYMPAAACSRFSVKMLKSVKYPPLMEKCRQNFQILMDAFGEFCFWRELGGFAPYAFPAIFSNRMFPHITADMAQSIMAKANILCSRQWHPIVTELHNPYHHSGAQKLSKAILLIPCDWRYGREDMERIIKVCREGFGEFEAKFK